jgi:hypothetical protein
VGLVADGSVNPAAVAGQYSAFAGLLAGFAFSGLVLYIGRQAAGSRPATVDQVAEPPPVRAADVAASLFYGMTSLGLCAFLYANLSGEEPTSGRALTAMLLYGTVLGLSVLSLWYSLTLMMFEHELTKNAARYAYWGVVVVGPAIVMRFMAGLAHEAWEVRCAAHPAEAPCGWKRVTPISVGFGALLLMLVLSSLITAVGIPRHRWAGGRRRPEEELTLFGRVWSAALTPLVKRRDMLAARPILPSVGVFTLAAVVMLISLFVTTRSAAITPPHWLIFGVLGAAFVLLGCFAFACGSIVGTRVGVQQNWLRKLLRRPRHAPSRATRL